MSKRRSTKYEHGDRYQVYINRTVDDELLSFINKQSDISGASMLGLILLYQTYGNIDIDDLLPRNYRVNANIPNLNNNIPFSIQNSEIRVPDTKVENDSIKNTGREEADIATTRPAISSEIKSKVSSETDDSLDSKNDVIPPIQNEVPTEKQPISKGNEGNGLKSINTNSMMAFASKMNKPNNNK